MSKVMDNQVQEPGAGTEERLPGVVFEVSDLRAGYGRVPVLHGVSFALQAGEALGIVGHNGMGKTTLLKALMGLLPVASGRISVDGVDITREPAHARSRLGIAYVPQGRGILPGLTALENLRLAWSADSGEIEATALERVIDTLPRLRALLDRKGGALSGGEQQILALGRALMPAPWLLLLDEPSEGIQPSIVQEIGEILVARRRHDKLSLLIVEQNLDLVLDVADRIVVVERGRIEREVDAHVVQAGGLADMLGMGGARAGSRPASGRPSGPPVPQRPGASGAAGATAQRAGRASAPATTDPA
ncbi:MAG TPA: ABC transporter ATP-binding protein, partial [Burkholderiales bacterium]